MRSDLEWLESWAGGSASQGSQWAPPLDVLEHPDRIEIRIDVAGVPADTLAITVQNGVLTVDGQKTPVCHGRVAFHVAERATGPFSRVLPLRLPFDARAIRATLVRGELRIVVPRMAERRGRPIRIPIEAA